MILPYQGNPGASKLGKVLADRMNKQGESPLVLDFGSIQGNYSLITNTFPKPIPKTDYTVCRHVAGLMLSTSGGTHGGHESGDGSHSHSVPVPKIKPGDRVLVAWIQNEVTVIDVIVSAGSL